MSHLKRGILAAALTTAIAGVLITPPMAYAQDIKVGIYFTEVLVGADSAGATERVVLLPTGPVVLNNFRLTIDFAELAGKVKLMVNRSECATAGTTLTCTEHFPLNLSGPLSILPEILFKPEPGVPAGTTGEIKITISAQDLAPVSIKSKVTVGEGVDLASDQELNLDAAPGGSVSPALEISNIGETTAHGTVAVFFGDFAFTAVKSYSNCSFRDGQFTFCIFDEDLLPGKTYRLRESLPLKLRGDTFAPGNEWLEIQWLTPAEFEILKKDFAVWNPDWFGTPGTGSKLELVEKESSEMARQGQVDVDPSDNWAIVYVTVTGNNPADLAAIGGSGSGAVGTIVSLSLGLKNLGPGTLDSSRSGEFTSQVNIELPPGASLTAMPDGCLPLKADNQPDWQNPNDITARRIACWPQDSVFVAGTQVTFSVKLKIDQVISSATGKVKVVTPFCENDCEPNYNPSNNIADVVLNAPAPSLPVTGAQAGLFAGIGSLLLVAGAALFVLTRRRRISLREG